VATIRVHLPGDGIDRSYDVHCGAGLLAGVGRLLREADAARAIVVADSSVADTHAATVAASLSEAGLTVHSIAVPAGETAKSPAELVRLWNCLAELAADRKTHLLAVGGGVVGDLTGFLAATYARGLAVWQVPTTLVAQVDSGIGGKTGINLAAGKNLVGAFWQPRGVIADIETLATLPDREFISGLAEVVKYGMILDPVFFAWLETFADDLVRRDAAALTHAVERSATLKAAVVEQDERETSGRRATLNYGHTFAHAYETAAGYGTILHGEAVAVGMARAGRLATALGRIGAEVADRQDRLLQQLRLPIAAGIQGPDAADRLLRVMARDKKAVDGRLRFVLPSRIGHVDLVDNVDPEVVRKILAGS